MKTLKFILALMCCVCCVPSHAASGKWRAQVDALMKQGEFKKASTLMRKLPKQVKIENEVAIDSLNTIMERIRKDFTMTPADGAELIREKVPGATDAQINQWKNARQIEVMNIDGQEWWFRKSVRNLWLLAPEFKQAQDDDKQESFKARREQFLASMKRDAASNGTRDWHRATITFKLDVDADAVPAGETLRVWMPYPYENLRQRNITYIQGNHPATFSTGSKHHTVYMEAVAQKGQPTHFEYSFAYDVAERHIAQQDLLAMLEPYDTSSDEYIEFTGNQAPHIVITDKMRNLAREIVGNETNPVLQAARIYDWISATFPWAGAREYSTLDNIPEYVLLNNHGDCGQVTLLYITLVRSLGIPARWESGWMIHPGEVNWHDWAETYFEGVGWVPTDQSFGRSAFGTSMNSYYATGIDLYRMASNEAVGDKLSPAKKYIRSETVDFQPGEVEWRKGNLYYDKWHSHLTVDSLVPIKY